ncbi:hypothetical protein [Photorhabdus sp. SF281]|uniref:hypothetical protein n=1 Tax=Photorhabdus sp. SF281 TaxID=3459527 RepID=UPI00404504A2
MSDNKRHVHADAMLEYALDASKTDEPWKLWEQLCADEKWRTLTSNPAWYPDYVYRRKPEMITVGSVSFPKPISEAPALDTLCYVVAIRTDTDIHSIFWHNSSLMFRSFLKQGLLHLTEDAAQQHLEAIVKINKGEF